MELMLKHNTRKYAACLVSAVQVEDIKFEYNFLLMISGLHMAEEVEITFQYITLILWEF